MTTPTVIQEQQPDFSLVLGGPFYQLLQRAHLTGPALEQLHRRILFFALITWLPLAVLSLIEGNPSGIKLTFLHDIEAHVRFLVAVPVLIAAELVVQLRMRITIRRFVDRGIANCCRDIAILHVIPAEEMRSSQDLISKNPEADKLAHFPADIQTCKFSAMNMAQLWQVCPQFVLAPSGPALPM